MRGAYPHQQFVWTTTMQADEIRLLWLTIKAHVQVSSYPWNWMPIMNNLYSQQKNSQTIIFERQYDITRSLGARGVR